MLLKSVAFACSTALCGMLTFTPVDTASAAKKLTFEQAYKVCKARIDRQMGGATDQNIPGRTAAGEACMKEYGYTLFGR